LTQRQAGISELELVHPIRVLVLSQFPETPNNAFWQLFSANAAKVSYGRKNYQWRQPRLSSVRNELFNYYNLEGIMSYTADDFVKDYTKKYLQVLSVEERLADLSPDQRLQGLSPDEVLQRFSPDQRLQGLSPDEVLQHWSPDDIEAYLSKLKSQRSH
jgi:hypothetical protein